MHHAVLIGILCVLPTELGSAVEIAMTCSNHAEHVDDLENFSPEELELSLLQTELGVSRSHEISASPEATAYHFSSVGARICPESSVPVQTKEECMNAGSSLGLTNFVEVQNPSDPTGCFKCDPPACGDDIPYFWNDHPTGSGREGRSPICSKKALEEVTDLEAKVHAHGEKETMHVVQQAEATCTCLTPNQGAAGKNGFQCSDGTSGYCVPEDTCFATTPFLKSDMSKGCGLPEVTCTCTTPNEGTAGKNGFQCSDSTSGYCVPEDSCFATTPFPKSDMSKGCGSPQVKTANESPNPVPMLAMARPYHFAEKGVNICPVSSVRVLTQEECMFAGSALGLTSFLVTTSPVDPAGCFKCDPPSCSADIPYFWNDHPKGNSHADRSPICIKKMNESRWSAAAALLELLMFVTILGMFVLLVMSLIFASDLSRGKISPADQLAANKEDKKVRQRMARMFRRIEALTFEDVLPLYALQVLGTGC